MLRCYKGKLDLKRKPVVYFLSFDNDGEEGTDVGGPTREFFQIVHDTILNGTHHLFPVFEGVKDHLLPIHKIIGKAIAHRV